MKAGRKGTILITTLWILALLTILALGVGIRIGVDIKLMSFFVNSAKAHYIAEAGLRKTILLLESDADRNVDTLNEIWACGHDFDTEEDLLKEVPLGEGIFTVGYVFDRDEEGNTFTLYGAADESARLNINELNAEDLQMLPGVTEDIAHAIIDWRDEDNLAGLGGAEDSHYKELEHPYECKDAPFSVPEELLLVRDVGRQIFDGIRDMITVYGTGKAVNINTVGRDVLSALLASEGAAAAAAKIIGYRNGEDGVPGTEDDKTFRSTKSTGGSVGIVDQLRLANVCTETELVGIGKLVEKKAFKVKSDIFRIVSVGSVKGGKVKKTIEAVVKRSDKKTELLYYYEF